MNIVCEDDMDVPFHLPSQQAQVNPARQVHLEPPDGRDPQ